MVNRSPPHVTYLVDQASTSWNRSTSWLRQFDQAKKYKFTSAARSGGSGSLALVLCTQSQKLAFEFVAGEPATASHDTSDLRNISNI